MTAANALHDAIESLRDAGYSLDTAACKTSGKVNRAVEAARKKTVDALHRLEVLLDGMESQ